MTGSSFPWTPSDRTLRQFGGLCLAFFSVLAVWHLRQQGHPAGVNALAMLAVAFGAAGWLRPRLLRPVFVGWMLAAFPIGWLVSQVSLALIYFGLFTPVAFCFRVLGRDALAQRRQPGKDTYWSKKSMPAGPASYFSQF
jgi:hypothetical protein